MSRCFHKLFSFDIYSFLGTHVSMMMMMKISFFIEYCLFDLLLSVTHITKIDGPSK